MVALLDYSGEIAAGFFALCLVIAAIWDMAQARIPNFIPLTMIAGFIVAAIAASSEIAWGSHFGAAGIMLVIMVPMFQFGWMGGGDVKLLVATALWLGLSDLAWLGLFTALAGGALAVALLSFRPIMRALIARGVFSEDAKLVERLSKEGKIPYGVAIAVGGIYLASSLMTLFS